MKEQENACEVERFSLPRGAADPGGTGVKTMVALNMMDRGRTR